MGKVKLMKIKYNPKLMAKNSMKACSCDEAHEKLLETMAEIWEENPDFDYGKVKLIALSSVEL